MNINIFKKIRGNSAALKLPAVVLLSFLLTWVLFRFFGSGISFFAFVPALFAVGYTVKKTFDTGAGNIRTVVLSVVFSVLLSGSYVVGGKIDTVKRVMSYFGRNDFIYAVLLAAAFFFLFYCVLTAASSYLFPAGKGKKPNVIFWAVCFLLISLFWIPYFFIYFPGSLSPDSVACVSRAVGRASLSNQQPVLYILLMRPFLYWGLGQGNINTGVAAFLLFQLVAMAAAFAYGLYWLRKKGCPLGVTAAILLYFILDPVFGMYAVTMWKDILFGGLMLLYILDIYDIVESRGEKLRSIRGLLWFLALSLLISFMRNNGYYIAAVMAVVFCIYYRKSFKRLAPAFLAFLIVVPVVQGPVYRLCGVSSSPFAESLAIPLQQIGRTVAEDGTVTPEQKEYLDHLLPMDEMKKAYNPLNTNDIKFHKDFNNRFLETHKLGFFETWAGMMGPNGKEYIRAFLMQTVGYWHVGTNNWVLYNGIGEGYNAQEHGLYSTDLLSGAVGRDLKQTVTDKYKKLGTVPVVSDVLNIGFLFWTVVLCAAALAARGKKRYILFLLPLFLLWATLLIATPVYCEFRYMFPFAVAMPFAAASVFLPEAAVRKPVKAGPGKTIRSAKSVKTGKSAKAVSAEGGVKSAKPANPEKTPAARPEAPEKVPGAKPARPAQAKKPAVPKPADETAVPQNPA